MPQYNIIKLCLDCNKPKSRKGDYCKACGYKHRLRPTGLQYIKHKENSTSFSKGHISWNKDKIGFMPIPWNKGTVGVMKSNKTSFKTGMIPWNKDLPYMQNENHPKWKGDKVGYQALHSWIARKLGKPNKCEKCGTKTARMYHWANISGEYKRDLLDWKRLCSWCHTHEHKNWEARWSFAA